jgi:hypothetical protein
MGGAWCMRRGGKELKMLSVAKSDGGQGAKTAKKIYSTPTLVTHGDVAKLTSDHHHKPHHYGDGPESELR